MTNETVIDDDPLSWNDEFTVREREREREKEREIFNPPKP